MCIRDSSNSLWDDVASKHADARRIDTCGYIAVISSPRMSRCVCFIPIHISRFGFFSLIDRKNFRVIINMSENGMAYSRRADIRGRLAQLVGKPNLLFVIQSNLFEYKHFVTYQRIINCRYLLLG